MQSPAFHLVHFGGAHHDHLLYADPLIGVHPYYLNGQGGRYYCSQFTGEKTEAQRGEQLAHIK